MIKDNLIVIRRIGGGYYITEDFDIDLKSKSIHNTIIYNDIMCYGYGIVYSKAITNKVCPTLVGIDYTIYLYVLDINFYGNKNNTYNKLLNEYTILHREKVLNEILSADTH